MRKTIFIAALVSLLVLSFVASAPAGSIMDRILKKGELVVGTTGTQPPLNAITKDGKIIGLDADIAKGIAMNMGGCPRPRQRNGSCTNYFSPGGISARDTLRWLRLSVSRWAWRP